MVLRSCISSLSWPYLMSKTPPALFLQSIWKPHKYAQNNSSYLYQTYRHIWKSWSKSNKNKNKSNSNSTLQELWDQSSLQCPQKRKKKKKKPLRSYFSLVQFEILNNNTYNFNWWMIYIWVNIYLWSLFGDSYERLKDTCASITMTGDTSTYQFRLWRPSAWDYVRRFLLSESFAVCLRMILCHDVFLLVMGTRWGKNRERRKERDREREREYESRDSTVID